MGALSIPEAIAENSHLSSDAKITFAELFARIKKGERPHVGLSDIGMQIALGGGNLLEAIRNLHAVEYAFLDESVDSLEDLIPGQNVRISPRIHIEVLPNVSSLDEDIAHRRFYGIDDKHFWDEAKRGRILFKASASRWMAEYELTIKRFDYPADAVKHGDATEYLICDGKPFASLNAAWAWFDEFMAGSPEIDEPPVAAEEPAEEEVVER